MAEKQNYPSQEMVFRLDDELWFPNPYLGESDGLLAVGGDLSSERLLLAYRNGIFPWYAFRHSKEPQWYCPLDRFVIFPKEIHISHSMRTFLHSNKLEVRMNESFEEVIRSCSSLRIGESYAWLGPEMIDAYLTLHKEGYATSVEVWSSSTLVGGLYGVFLEGCFFGESMFSHVANASKLALIHLCRSLSSIEHSFIDCQFETPHLKSMGGRHISYSEYMSLIEASSHDISAIMS